MTTDNINHTGMKLGKSAPVDDPKTLQLGNYINDDQLPAAAPTVLYGETIGATAWGMMCNDKINNCTCAAAGHLIMGWTSTNGKQLTPTDDAIVAAYAAITGYNGSAGTMGPEAGIKEVLNYWRKTGIDGHKIMAYAALQPQNQDHVKQAVYLFGGCYVGLALPLSAQTQAVWDIPKPSTASVNATKGSWGGHVVAIIGYDTNGLTAVTWGVTKKMTWDFWNAYCDESYAVISTDFVAGKTAPNGFDLKTLQQDLKLVTAS